jgi:probable HAF family extracellular repeat protein
MKRLVIALGTWLSLAAMALGQTYRLNELVLPRGTSGFARGLNIDGAAAGSAGETHGTDVSAAVWDHTGHPSDIGRLPGGDFSDAFGINDAGEVVGGFNTAGVTQPFHFNGSLIPLPLPAADDSGQANAINNASAITGWTSGPAGQHAVVWSSDSPTVLPGALGVGLAINVNNQVVGSSQDTGVEHAILWNNGQATDLGTLPGDNQSRAIGINNAGQVVGYSRGMAGQHAFLFNGTAMTDLGVLGGTDYSEASGINNNGVVVGTTDTSQGKHAFIWTPTGGMVDLNTQIVSQRVVLTAALAINDKGQILAIGSPDHNPNSKAYDVYDHTSHAGVVRVYLLTPVGAH